MVNIEDIGDKLEEIYELLPERVRSRIDEGIDTKNLGGVLVELRELCYGSGGCLLGVEVYVKLLREKNGS